MHRVALLLIAAYFAFEHFMSFMFVSKGHTELSSAWRHERHVGGIGTWTCNPRMKTAWVHFGGLSTSAMKAASKFEEWGFMKHAVCIGATCITFDDISFFSSRTVSTPTISDIQHTQEMMALQLTGCYEKFIVSGHSFGGYRATQFVKALNDIGANVSVVLFLNTYDNALQIASLPVSYQVALQLFPACSTLHTDLVMCSIGKVIVLHSSDDELIPYEEALRLTGRLSHKHNVVMMPMRGNHCNFDVTNVHLNAIYLGFKCQQCT